MNVKELKELLKSVLTGKTPVEIRVFPVTRDGVSEIIVDESCKSKPILQLCVWKSELVLFYEGDEECM